MHSPDVGLFDVEQRVREPAEARFQQDRAPSQLRHVYEGDRQSVIGESPSLKL